MSSKIVDILSMDVCPITDGGRAKWTAIIPAAGRGSRLCWSGPKILYPILGRPMINWLIDILDPFVSKIVLIVSPSGEEAIKIAINKLTINAHLEICIQCEPSGMGDAILVSEPFVETPNALVIWGDQIMLSQHTIRAGQILHDSIEGVKLTLVTLIKKFPYINIVRNVDSDVINVQQAREGEIDSDYGESDCGAFLFNTSAMFHGLKLAKKLGYGLGVVTNEFNLLQALPVFQVNQHSIKTLRIHEEEECMGVNTQIDAKIVEKLLLKKYLSNKK